MYSIYVLKSLKNGKRYIGSTGIDVKKRLEQHNYGSNKWTNRNKLFKLIYNEQQYKTRTDARKRENFLKSGVGRKFLDNLLLK